VNRPDPEHEHAENERRKTVNLVAAITLLLLLIGGYWLMNYLEQRRKLEMCLEAGRRDCLNQFDPSVNAPR